MVSQPRIELVFFDLIVVSPFDPERVLEMLHKKAGGGEEEGGEDTKGMRSKMSGNETWEQGAVREDGLRASSRLLRDRATRYVIEREGKPSS